MKNISGFTLIFFFTSPPHLKSCNRPWIPTTEGLACLVKYIPRFGLGFLSQEFILHSTLQESKLSIIFYIALYKNLSLFFAPFERYEITQKIYILFYFSSTLFKMAKNILTAASLQFHCGIWKILERFEKERKMESNPTLAKTKSRDFWKRKIL